MMTNYKKSLLQIISLSLLFGAISCNSKKNTETDQPTVNSSEQDTSEIGANEDAHLTRSENSEPEEYVNEKRQTKVPQNAKFISEENDTTIYKNNGLILTEGALSGEFIEIQRGDYLHLILKDSLNIYHTFFIMLDDEKWMNELWMEENYPEYGSKIMVHWKRQRIQVLDFKIKMTIYAAVKIEDGRENKESVYGNNLSMDKFLEKVIGKNNIHIKDSLLSIGNKEYYFRAYGPMSDCQSHWCLEEYIDIRNKNNTHKTSITYWKYYGFFGDINNDKNLDFIFLSCRGWDNCIYEADTFGFSVLTLNEKNFEFIPLTDKLGKEYSIEIVWQGMWDDKKDRVRLIKQHWPFSVEW